MDNVIEYDMRFPTRCEIIREKLSLIPNFPFHLLEDYCLLILKVDDEKKVLEIRAIRK